MLLYLISKDKNMWGGKVYQNILEKINENQILDYLSELIEIQSPQNDIGKVKDFVRRVAGHVKSVGFDEVKIDGMGNLIARIKGSAKHRSLMYFAYAGTFPAGDMNDPFTAKMLDGVQFGVPGKVIRGRGVVEQKSILAAMYMAAKAVMDSKIKLKGDFILAVSTAGETGNHEAAIYMVEKDGLHADMGIVGMYTNNEVCLGARGRVDLEVTVSGRSVHSSTPELGINALEKMARIVEASKKLTMPVHVRLGSAALTAVGIECLPKSHATIPDTCIAIFDRRLLPNETPEKARMELSALVERLKQTDPELDAEVKIQSFKSETLDFKIVEMLQLPFDVNPDLPIVKSLCKAITTVTGKNSEKTYVRYICDGGYLNSVGIESAVFGPGDPKFAHTSNDVVPIDKVTEATKALAFTMVDLLSQ